MRSLSAASFWGLGSSTALSDIPFDDIGSELNKVAQCVHKIYDLLPGTCWEICISVLVTEPSLGIMVRGLKCLISEP